MQGLDKVVKKIEKILLYKEVSFNIEKNLKKSFFCLWGTQGGLKMQVSNKIRTKNVSKKTKIPPFLIGT